MQLQAVFHKPLKLLATLLLLLLSCAVFVLAAPSPEPASQSIYISSNDKYNKDKNYNENYQYDGDLVSGASIYAYTVDNQLSNTKQEQQKYNYNNKNNNYIINFETNAKPNENNYKIRELSPKPTTTTTTTTTSSSSSKSTYSTITPTQPAPNTGCNYDRLAVYKVVLQTYWTRNLFPKHYPDWRPTAQWTKTIGRTHDASFALFHIGQQSSMGVKQFAETGKSEILDNLALEQQQQAQGQGQGQAQGQQKKKQSNVERNVFDEFNMPSIVNGAGRSEAKFFVDSNHSFVSLMTRIVPSPDWFIGVDSFQLCVGGSWIDTVTVEMDPLDAGTDNGFTFTAPNWPTSPQGVIYRITSRYPAHPAGSFFYPKNKRLPPIATFQFIKLKEYELSEVFNIVEDERKYETVKTQVHLEAEQNNIELNELSASIERERQTELSVSLPTAESEKDRIRSQLLAKMKPLNNASDSVNLGGNSNVYIGNIVPKNDKNAIMQTIAHSYQSNSFLKRRRARRQRDCRVSHWSQWSACSKSCGIGEMHRFRKIIKHGKRGGRPCPALRESKWCGSEKGCHNTANYFNWSNT